MNRFVKSATYEGMHVNGIPTQDLIDHHVGVVKGGTALTTVSYGAVSPEGRTFKDQMWLNEESVAELKKLAYAVHKEGGKVSIQLTQCGSFLRIQKLTNHWHQAEYLMRMAFYLAWLFQKQWILRASKRSRLIL